MDIDINEIVSSSLFRFLCGSGGVIVIILAILQLFKKEKNKSDTQSTDVNVNVNINDNLKGSSVPSEIPYNLYIEKWSQTVVMSYEELSFKSEEFYVNFLSKVEEKKRGKDYISYD